MGFIKLKRNKNELFERRKIHKLIDSKKCAKILIIKILALFFLNVIEEPLLQTDLRINIIREKPKKCILKWKLICSSARGEFSGNNYCQKYRRYLIK